jgi:hypothetical protein
MKTIIVVTSILAAATVSAQPTPEPALESQFSAQLGKTGSLAEHEVKPNEVVIGRTTYSGIAVQLLKTDNPLQLIDPFAPPKYGSPGDNVMPDTFPAGAANGPPDSFFGRVLRLKIFSIDF